MKVCKVCGENKKMGEFGGNEFNEDKLHNICLECEVGKKKKVGKKKRVNKKSKKEREIRVSEYYAGMGVAFKEGVWIGYSSKCDETNELITRKEFDETIMSDVVNEAIYKNYVKYMDRENK